MTHTIRAACCAAVAIVAAAGAHANPLNPEISAIGDTRAFWSEESDEVTLAFHELEIGLVGPVNPYARAEVYAAIHGEEGIEVEEAKLLLDRYLPGGLGLTVGLHLLAVGQINPTHPHAYPFVDRPLMHTMLFGEDGARDVGAQLDWLAPLDAATLRLSAGVVRGDVFTGGHAHEEAGAHEEKEDHAHEEEHAEDEEPEIGVSARADVFAELGRDVALSIGGTVLAGDDASSAIYAGPDLKARVDLGPRSSLVLRAEALFGRLDDTEETPASDPWGWFAAADLQLGRRWNTGVFAESATERLNDEAHATRIGAFAGHALMEESTLFRLLVRHTDPHEGESEVDVVLQVLFGLGPHAAHRF